MEYRDGLAHNGGGGRLRSFPVSQRLPSRRCHQLQAIYRAARLLLALVPPMASSTSIGRDRNTLADPRRLPACEPMPACAPWSCAAFGRLADTERGSAALARLAA